MNVHPARRAVSTLVQFRLLVVLAVVLVIGWATLPDFVTISTLQAVLDRAAVVGFLALGLTPVILAGHIDLSVGSTLTMAGIATIYFQSVLGNVPGALVGLAVGALIGAINAALVVTLRISSLVATLATLLIVASMALLLTDSQPLTAVNPRFGLGLSGDFLAVFSPQSAMFLLATVLMAVWLRAFPSGRHLYAVGSNAVAATASGINANAYVVTAFVLSGLCSGAAGVLQSLSTATGSPLAGSATLIPAITAVVIGGTRLEGGRGSALATLGGVVALGALTMMLEFNNVPSYTQDIYIGALLISLIALDRFVSADSPSSESSRALNDARVVPVSTK